MSLRGQLVDNIRFSFKYWDGVQSSLDSLKKQTETYIQESSGYWRGAPPLVGAREGDTIANPSGTTARIVRILSDKALLDLNHPLAGKPLLVSLQIVNVENSK